MATTEIRRVLIIGAGQAGGEAAQRLRQGGFEGEITLIGEEPCPPYQRPPLSKAYLSGDMDMERLLLRPASVYADERIALLAPVRTVWIDRAGRRLGACLTPGDVVCLSGRLGAGKTTLARGAVETWTGRAEDAPSPTYTLVQTYDGPKGELWHVDLYRLKRAEESWELGLEDAFAAAACLIEWPERLAGRLPRDRLDIALAPDGEGRRATLSAHGAWRTPLDAI